MSRHGYDFQYHPDTRSFYSYQNAYSVTNHPTGAGQYTLGVYKFFRGLVFVANRVHVLLPVLLL